MKKILLAFIIGLMTIPCSNSSAQIPIPDDTILKIGSMELPIYGFIDEEGRNSGVFYDFLTEVATRSGLTFENSIMPYLRTIGYLKSGDINMLISTYNEQVLDAGEPLSYLWSYKYILVVGKNSGIKSIEDLRGKSLIYVGQGVRPELKDLPAKIYRVKNFEQSIQMLKRWPGLDAIVISERSYDYLLKKLEFTREDFGSVIPMDEIREEWIFVDRNMPPKTRETLKRATEDVKTDNVFEKLLDKYNVER